MAVYLSPLGGVGAQFFDNNGDPLAGGKLYSYAAGTTTPQVTYTTSSGNTPHTNPIILNSAGRVSNGGEIWLTENVNYKFILTNSNDVLLATWDNVPGINDGSNDSSLIIYDPPFANSVPTTVENKLAESVSVQDFGAVGDGVTDDTQAFVRAALASDTVYVPNGTYRIDTPFSLNPTAAYYGPGVLQFDNAESWRAGGSAGPTALTERYTLFFKYTNQANVYCYFSGVPQTLTWITDNTFEVPAPGVGVSVIYGVLNGTLQLGDTPEQIFSYNTFANGGWDVAPALPNPLTSPVGFNNVALGARALKAVTTGVNNTAVGSRALTSVKTGYNNTAVGFQTLYRIQGGYDNTAVGSIAGEWLITGYQNSLFGLAAGGKLTDGRFNVAVGFEALGEASSTIHTVAVGYRANANTGSTSQSNSVYVGSFAGDFCKGGNTVAIGYRALNCQNNVVATPQDFTVVGAFAGRYVDDGTDCVIIGVGAAANYAAMNFSTVVGMEAADTAVGGTIDHLTTLGWRAARAVTGNGNTAVGSGALVTETSGTNNTAVGFNAGRLSIAGAATNFSNTTTLGHDARVSGSDQVQLGNSSTTTYAWGAVQNRSDARDKADVRDTILGLDFICDLRPVDYRWDIRDDYVVVDAEGQATTLSKDGSKTRKRYHHGLIAQEIKVVMDKHGVDFGGYQNHALSGGEDVLTVGYEELISPLIKAIQELTARVKELEAKC